MLCRNQIGRVEALGKTAIHLGIALPRSAWPAEEGPDAYQYGAVLLFLVRSQAGGAIVSRDRRVAPAIAAICRQLDGIPLAIELAAARAATLGIDGLAQHLNDRFQVLTGGRRTALPRRQTLRATLDWSYGLLTDDERLLFRRLAIFAGSFTLEAASNVASAAEPGAVELLADLVSKSLVAAEVGGVGRRFRLLDTTRTYALQKLRESGEIRASAADALALFNRYTIGSSRVSAHPTCRRQGSFSTTSISRCSQ